MFALAAALPGPRTILLAGTTLASGAWLGLDGLREDRPGPRARLVMAVAVVLLASLPAFLLAADNGLWNGRPIPNLTGGLVLWSAGIAAVALGSRLAAVRFRRAAPKIGPAIHRTQTLVSAEPRRRSRLAALSALVLVCFAAFVAKVGGPVSYIKNLDNSGAYTYGLTYLIWGISFAKFGTFLYLSENWAHRRRPSNRLLAATALSLLLLLFIGSRLLVIVALIQLVLLYGAVRPSGRRFRLLIALAAVAGTLVFVVVGELRRWEGVSHHQSFPSYLIDTGLPDLPRTYVNNYADAARLSVIARNTVPRHAPYEYGKEFLRILLQPLPSEIRPKVGLAPALTAAFTSGNHNGDALPVPVEGYIEYGMIGAILFSLALGIGVGLVDRFSASVSDVGWLAASVAASTGMVMIFRGSLEHAVALTVIDVVGFFIAHRFIFKLSVDARDGPGTEAVPNTPALESAASIPGSL